MLTGSTPRIDRNKPPGKTAKSKTKKAKNIVTVGTMDPAPLQEMVSARNSLHFLAFGQASLPVDSMGNPWSGSYVTATGDLKMDLLHNFFLE